MNTRDELLQDLSPFADIGTTIVSPHPKKSSTSTEIVVQLTRDGHAMKLAVDRSTGKVQLSKAGYPTLGYASFPRLLASPSFANLVRWADTQAEVLKREAVDAKKMLPINGKTHHGSRVEGVEQVDALMGVESRGADAAEVLLIDGPAGIGKTNLVEHLALARAAAFRTSSKPLLLHVKSRGRVLSNLQDLMAFSLQTIRSTTTYDQVPVLVKHGLVVVAIDGFDELGDPNGYELAWSQVNDLIFSVRGKGTVILSGRDTFLGRARLFRDVQSLRLDVDVVTGLTLDSPTADQARTWLRSRNWTDVHFQTPAVAALLEDGSFALRPVFLTLFAEHIKPKDLRSEIESYLTPLLVKHIIHRDAALFGPSVDAVLTRAGIENFLLKFLIEVARDMADSQTDAMDEATLTWIADASLGDDVSEEVRRLVRNRAGVVAFLKPDQRLGYKAFAHSHLQNYFLSLATIQAIGAGELPKFIRRNLVGSEFLSVFIDVTAKVSDKPQLTAFLQRSIGASNAQSSADRATRNIGALLLAALPTMDPTYNVAGYEVDEAVIRGTCSGVVLSNVTIHQLDCRNADLSLAQFEQCAVVSLIANGGSRFSPSFPLPKLLSVEGDEASSSSAEISDWLSRRGRNAQSTVATGLASPDLKAHPVYRLLGRACRVRQYWLRAGDDIQADKILRDQYWPTLASALRESGYLREEQRQASGSSSTFTHIRQRERILLEDQNDAEVVELFSRLEKVIRP
jgi:hypothetical protein